MTKKPKENYKISLRMDGKDYYPDADGVFDVTIPMNIAYTIERSLEVTSPPELTTELISYGVCSNSEENASDKAIAEAAYQEWLSAPRPGGNYRQIAEIAARMAREACCDKIEARIALYQAKLAEKDPLGPDDCNSYEMTAGYSEACEYLLNDISPERWSIFAEQASWPIFPENKDDGGE